MYLSTKHCIAEVQFPVWIIVLVSDRCLLEHACCLRKDAAVQGGTSYECNVSLDQKDALHGCTSPHLDIARDLPEDILW